MFAAKFFEPTLLAGLAAVAALLACGVLVPNGRVPVASRRGFAVLLGVAAVVLAGAAREVRSRGFQATYFAERGFVGEPVHTVLEPDFQMQVVRGRVLHVSQRRFSVRWSGWAAPVQAGPHFLRVWNYGRVEIFVDGQSVLASAPGQPGAKRIFDGRTEYEVPLDLAAGFHHWEFRYEPSRDAAYALSVELEDRAGHRSRFASSLILPVAPGPGLALGPGAVLVAAGSTVATAGVVFAGLVLWLLLRLARHGGAVLGWLEASGAVRMLARPAMATRRLAVSIGASRGARWLAPCLLVLLAVPVLFGRLGERPMWGDEVIHATTAAHAALDGHWYPLHFEGKIYLEKPPLKIWAEALVFRGFGLGATQARALDATAGLLTVLALYLVAARSRLLRDGLDPTLGVFAGAIMVMAPTFVHDHGARGGVQDATLLLSTVVTFGLALEGLRASALGRHRRGLVLMLLGGVAMSIGYGVKILAGVLPGVVWGVFQFGAVSLAGLRGEPLRLRERAFATAALGLVPVLVLVLWTAFNLQVVGERYLDAMHGTLVGRAQGALGSVQPAHFYLSHIVGGPFAIGVWGRLVPLALVYGIWRWSTPARREACGAHTVAGLAVTTTIVTVALYSLSRAKHPWYVLPAYPWMALLVASLLLHGTRALSEVGPWPRLRSLAVLGVAAGVIWTFWLSVPNAAPWLGGPPRRDAGTLVAAAAEAAPGAVFYVLDEHDIPPDPVEAMPTDSTTYRRSLMWSRTLLRSHGRLEDVSEHFEPPPRDEAFFVLVRSERALPVDAPWLGEITVAAALDEELTLLGGRVVGEAFQPFPVVAEHRLPLEIPACGNLRAHGVGFQVVVPSGARCSIAIAAGSQGFPWWSHLLPGSLRSALPPAAGVQIRLLGRTAAPVRIDFDFDADQGPWTGSIAAWVGGRMIAFTEAKAHSVSLSLPAGSLDGVDVAIRLVRLAPGRVRLERLRISREDP